MHIVFPQSGEAAEFAGPSRVNAEGIGFGVLCYLAGRFLAELTKEVIADLDDRK